MATILFLVLAILGLGLYGSGNLGRKAVDRFYLDAMSFEAMALRVALYVGPAFAAIGIGGFLGCIR